MAIVSLQLIVIKTNKLPELVKFYSALGLVFDHHRHGNGPLHFSAAAGATVLELYPLPKGIASPDATTRLGFTVQDLDGVLRRLKEMNTSVVTEPVVTEWGCSGVVLDPDGRKIELTQSGIA